MGRRNMLRADLSMFMSIIFMLAGCLLIMLISNLAIVIVDPATVVISGIIRAPGMQRGASGNLEQVGKIDPGGNVDKLPHFVDVNPGGLIFYPGGNRAPLASLAQPGNSFENLLDAVAPRAEHEYVVLIVRPGTAALTRKLRAAVTGRGIDIGLEIYEANQPVNYVRSLHASPKGG